MGRSGNGTAAPAGGGELYPKLGAGAGEGRGAELATTLCMGVGAAAAAGIVGVSGFHAPGMEGVFPWVAAAVLAACVALAAGWRRGEKSFGTWHFFVRYAFGWTLAAVLVGLLGGTGLDGVGMGAFVSLLAAGAMYAPARVLARAMLLAGDAAGKGVRLGHAACREGMWLGLLAGTGCFLTGAIVVASEPYGTDPTVLLLVIWLAVAVLACGALGMLANYAGFLYGHRTEWKAIDDPGKEVPEGSGRYGAWRF